MQMRLIDASSHADGMAVEEDAGSDHVESSHVHIVELDAPLDTTHELTFIGGRTLFFYAVFRITQVKHQKTMEAKTFIGPIVPNNYRLISYRMWLEFLSIF